MSYEIEYKGEVYKDVSKDSSEPSFLLIITAGDNNVYEASNRRRARGTYIISYGWNYSIIQDVCRRAGSCEGGGLQPGNKWMKPEDYLKRYRTKIKNAPSINEFFTQCNMARFELVKNPDDWQQKYFEEYKDYIHEENNHYHPEEKEKWCEIRITNHEEFKKFRDLWCIARFRDAICLVSSNPVSPLDFAEIEVEETEKPVVKQSSLEGY